MLRRRLHEDSSVALQWTDTTLNLYLDKGLQYMHRQVLKIDPDAIIYTAEADLTNGTSNYPLPANAQREQYVYLSDDGGATYGARQDYIPYYKIAERIDGDQYTGYAKKGRFLVIAPTPTSNVTEGLKIEYIPTLSMATDAEVPDLVEDTHEGIVYRAEMMALADAGVPAELAEKELIVIVTDLPLYYRHTEAPRHIESSGTNWDTQ